MRLLSGIVANTLNQIDMIESLLIEYINRKRLNNYIKNVL